MKKMTTHSRKNVGELNIKTLKKGIAEIELVDKQGKKEMYGMLGKVFGIRIVEDHTLPENFWYIKCSPDVYKAIQKEIKDRNELAR